jgi:uncharacterized membrane protein
VSSVDHHIDVEVPLTAAYDEWTRFERLPRFMDGVDEVRQVDETHLLWRAVYDGVEAEWTCEIVEQRPEERIAWRSTSGLTLGGVVAFHPLGDGTTRVMIMAEVDSAAAPIVAQRLKDALASFKAMMEAA